MNVGAFLYILYSEEVQILAHIHTLINILNYIYIFISLSLCTYIYRYT